MLSKSPMSKAGLVRCYPRSVGAMKIEGCVVSPTRTISSEYATETDIFVQSWLCVFMRVIETRPKEASIGKALRHFCHRRDHALLDVVAESTRNSASLVETDSWLNHCVEATRVLSASAQFPASPGRQVDQETSLTLTPFKTCRYPMNKHSTPEE
jgi:hypothetical protein